MMVKPVENLSDLAGKITGGTPLVKVLVMAAV